MKFYEDVGCDFYFNYLLSLVDRLRKVIMIGWGNLMVEKGK